MISKQFEWITNLFAYADDINSYEKVKTFKYLASLVTDQNSIQTEMKCRLKAGNSCYYSVQTLLSFQLLSYKFRIKRYVFPAVLHGCEA